MARPNFFCDIEALNCLLNMEFEGDYRDVELTFDLVELPYYFMFSGSQDAWTLKVFSRGEIYSHDGSGIEAGKLVVDKATQEGEISANNQSLAQNMGAFFQACRNISSYIQDENLEAVYADFDPEEKGILLSAETGELTWKVVEGKERPDLMCTTLFGGPTMCRPYMEDFWERSMREEMSLEEKIEAAEDGDTECMAELGQMYLNGEEVDEDPEQAVYWFRKMAEAGESNGMFNLGLHCAKGFGIARDFAQAAYWMEQAAENGDEDAPALAEKFRKAAAAEPRIASGDAQAQADLAAVYMFVGNSLGQADPAEDYAIAFDLAKKAADQDNGDGIWTLALAYQHGRGVPANIDIAIELYERGAELGHAASQHSLACYYLTGDVLEKDSKKGFELCMKAAQQGYGLAMRDVGRCYQFGNGVMGNMRTAVEWYEKALEVLDDPELARKTAMFKMMGENDAHWGEDYPGTDEDDFDDDFDFDEEEEEDDSDLPDGFMAAMEAFMEAEEYENELADAGLIPDAPRPGGGLMQLNAGGFPRIALKAEEGDPRALEILAKMDAANGLE